MEIYPAKQSLVISDDLVPVAAYQAIYHKLTEKTDKITHTFDDAYRISKDDLSNLHLSLNQSVRQYPIEAKNCSIDISLRKGESYSYRIFDNFMMQGFTTNKPTSSIPYNMNFMTCLPTEVEVASTVVQRYKVNVLVDQDFIDDDSIQPYFLRKLFQGNNIVLKIEYTDYNVALNIKSSVIDWVNGLTSSKPSALLLWLFKHEQTITLMSPRIILVSTMVSSAIVSFGHLSTTFESMQSIVFAVLAFGIFFYSVAQALISGLYQTLHQLTPSSVILLTAGDNKRSETLEKNLEKKRKFAAILTTTLFLTVPLSIFTKWLGLIIFSK